MARREKPSSREAVKVPAPAREEVALSAPERLLLAEALRLADDARQTMEHALITFGNWMLVNVFANDASAALEGRTHNPLWRELLGRAGGPTLRLSRRLLYVAVEIAARDRRINDESWRLLEPSRKERLLPLGDEDLMRDAAQYVVAMKLTLRATEAYVRALREARGVSAAARLTGPRLAHRVRRFRENLATTAMRRKLRSLAGSLSTEEKAAVKDELASLRDWAEEALRTLRKG
jgi:hypothetical protein